jgi:hypothetical protein
VNASLISIRRGDGVSGIAVDGSNLFLVDGNAGTIGEYTTSGKTVNANLVTGLGLDQAYGGVVVSGSDLFAGVQAYYDGAGWVGEYTTAGKTVNAKLVSETGGDVIGVAVSGTDLYFLTDAGKIYACTTSGKTVNASLVSGLAYPEDIALSGSDLFVMQLNNPSDRRGSIGEYTTAGKLVSAELISGLDDPYAIAVASSQPLSLALHTVQTSSTLATGNTSPSAGDAPLTTTATVSNKLKLWLGVSATEGGSARSSLTSAASNAFSKLGVIQPDGNATYSATFNVASDEVSLGLTMTPSAGVMNILDMVLPQKAWTASTKLIDELEKIYKTTALGSAVRSLIAGADGTTTSASSAHSIADDSAALFSNSDAQLKVLEADLKPLGITLTSAELKTLDNLSAMDGLARKLIATAQLDTQLKSGAPILVEFKAKAS